MSGISQLHRGTQCCAVQGGGGGQNTENVPIYYQGCTLIGSVGYAVFRDGLVAAARDVAVLKGKAADTPEVWHRPCEMSCSECWKKYGSSWIL
jgi:hypothetical protein